MVVRSLLTFLFAVFLMLVLLQNQGASVDFQIFSYRFVAVPLWAVALVCVVAGAVFAFIVALVGEVTLRVKLWRKSSDIRRLERELDALRDLIIEEEEKG